MLTCAACAEAAAGTSEEPSGAAAVLTSSADPWPPGEAVDAVAPSAGNLEKRSLMPGTLLPSGVQGM